ncbi:hypothetical protein M422DRAFT_39376 [Sphaerobolus stellatus SS14]|uniref:Uncharacterized protein n=1 Tax=Sphaerobolus stellatus (strain SS14) TaxID=990650 RepID=A0A0C9T517_SPHS4|nr:hypothetical protein M422DRAFT_39376 [Sphaerobolus stellatus SS14]
MTTLVGVTHLPSLANEHLTALQSQFQSLFVREYTSRTVLIIQRVGSEELESFVCQPQDIISCLDDKH